MPVSQSDQLRQHALIDVLELVDVQAPGAELVLAQPAEQIGGFRPVCEAVEREAGFPGGEPDRWSVALPAARVLVVVPAEPHNCGTPHLRRLTRDPGHQREQAEPVPAPDRMLDGGEELRHGRAGCLGLVFSHEGSLADAGSTVSRTLRRQRRR